jgi:hypothetical protein
MGNVMHLGLVLVGGPIIAVFLLALLAETRRGRWDTAARVAVPLAVMVVIATVLWVATPG